MTLFPPLSSSSPVLLSRPSLSSSSASSSSFLDRAAAFRPDLHRMGSFMAFVAFYSAGPGYLAYNVLYPRFLPGRPLVTAVLDAIEAPLPFLQALRLFFIGIFFIIIYNRSKYCN